MNELASLAYRGGDVEEALRLLRRALGLEPSNEATVTTRSDWAGHLRARIPYER